FPARFRRLEIPYRQLDSCLYGGTCSSDGSTYQCLCKNGYSGIICENDPCSPDPCLNGSFCSVNENYAHGYYCRCRPGFSGLNCEITPCSNNPCQNGGTCSVFSSDYICKCPDGYIGETCDITPCSSNPCVNGGTCSENESPYVCSCPTCYTGNNCEICTYDCAKFNIKFVRQTEKNIEYRHMKVNCANRAAENDADSGFPAFFRNAHDYNQYKLVNFDRRKEYLGYEQQGNDNENWLNADLSPITFDDWDDGQPDKNGEHCAQFRLKNYDGWHDINCGAKKEVSYTCRFSKKICSP
ncbi:unnamed protein product, partial [Oikopleura dioica]